MKTTTPTIETGDRRLILESKGWEFKQHGNDWYAYPPRNDDSAENCDSIEEAVDYAWDSQGDDTPDNRPALPPGLKVFGSPPATVDYPQCVAPEKYYMAVPVIASGHITGADMETLESYGSNNFNLGYGNGIILWWGVDADDEEIAEAFPAMSGDGLRPMFSDTFRHVVQSFRNLGYNYLRLDSDGDEVPGLPTFEW